MNMLNKLVNSFRKVILNVSDFSRLKGEDVILASFPKTGNTWVRYFFYNYFNNTSDVDDLPSLSIIDANMPEIGVGNVSKKWKFNGFPKIVKTHKKYNSIFRKNRVIYVVRNPLDIMLSYYHYAKGVKEIDYSGSKERFIFNRNYGLEAFFKHYESWKNKSDLIIKYEDLKNDSFTNFKKILLFLEVKVDEERIKRAIEFSSMKSVRQSQAKDDIAKNRFKKDFVFARSGKTNVGKKEMTEDLLNYYADLKSKYNFNLY